MCFHEILKRLWFDEAPKGLCFPVFLKGLPFDEILKGQVW